MRCPCEDDLRLLHLLVLLDCDEVGKCLERVACCSLHAENRLSGILDELIDDCLAVIEVSVLEVWHQNMCVAKVDILAMNTVPVKPTENNETPKNQPSVVSIVLIVIISLIALFAAAIFGMRIYGKIKMMTKKRHSQQDRKGRRRSR